MSLQILENLNLIPYGSSVVIIIYTLVFKANHTPTYNSLDVGAFQCGQTQISNLDQSCGAIDEDVVTLQVSVDDGLTASVKKVETSQDLTTPATNHLWLDGFQTTHVPGVCVCVYVCM